VSDPGAGRRTEGERGSSLEALRQRAEAKVAELVRSHPEDPGSLDLQRLMHEVNVHQAELEMQNDELSRTQLALEVSRARYHDLYDRAPVGYVTFGMNGLIMEANRLAASLLGVPAHRLPGERLSAFVVPEQQQVFSERYARLLAHAGPQSCELQLVRHDRTRFWAQLQMAIVLEEPPTGPHCRAAFVDISERIEAQQALYRRVRQLDLLSQSGQMLIMADAAGPGLFTDVFRKVSEAIGTDIYLSYQAGPAPQTLELVGSFGLSDDERARVALIPIGETLCGMVAARRTVLVLDELQSSDLPQAGALRALGARCYAGFPLLAGNSLVGVVGFASRRSDRFLEGDLPLVHTVCAQVAPTLDRLRLVSELRANDEALKNADRGKDEFIATLAHELRNPLAPIYHAVGILERLGAANPVQKDLVEMMQRQLSAMVRLVDDLLEISRMTRGKLDLQMARVELADVLRTAVETSKPLIETGAHSFTVELPGEPLVIEGDPVRLAQVFSNLLNNAAKYTDSGGQIQLSARRDDDRVEVSVHDNGHGISADLLPRVFDMFTQGAPRGCGRGGLGIGLTLVRILVGMHGGSVEANSPGAGGGSTFRVRLPLVPGQAEGRTAHAAATPLTSRCRVLLVDDNPDVADTLGRLLRMLGAEVEVVYDGPSALQALERFHPTAMILDIGMPGMDGYEVARRIRQHPQGRDITLIALTGWGQTEDRLRSRRTGFDHHLVKPADLEELQRLLGAERQ
jgi:PAS domain S-box-containing protein